MENDIYFCGSISAGREDVVMCMGLIEHLKKYGKVLSEHVGDIDLSALGE